MTVISRPVALHVVGHATAVLGRLRYDDTRQLQVELVSYRGDGSENSWTFARSLLADGLDAVDVMAGRHLVQVYRRGERLYFRLRNNVGEFCELWIFAAEAALFLALSYELVPAGAEAVGFGAELDAIVAGGAR